MNSWRDTASASAQEDLDGLLNLVLPLAQELLGKNGRFYPFGASVSTGGEASLTAADAGLGDHPQPDRVLAGVYDGARAAAAETRAAAFVSDVLVGGSDAVQVELEHRDGIALVVLVPYQPATFKRVPAFREMSVAPGTQRVWTAG
ncbi:hypothetical protein ASC77_04980 [Nocardioides sp. Root1257]|uniref:hypothetical protein n=1 Tax=unclassified Nocardioides TaxID=2615069 RepID=UPI000702290D|nr:MULTISPECIES: hypothetical protein [unclassified Nocardioides]KQW53624.1 hypothetical protein ASC77_04980 [Nocardioides sp. Root1257]KRC56310.1 hypothetical protein ASE24_04980 [Nocardioides sp. Root224]